MTSCTVHAHELPWFTRFADHDDRIVLSWGPVAVVLDRDVAEALPSLLAQEVNRRAPNVVELPHRGRDTPEYQQ